MERRMALRRRRAPGQSLPLIALMIVVLVAMVGLSVDVGNTFSEERQAVAAANAASLSGMNTVIRNTDPSVDLSNQDVYNAIVNSLRSNGIEVAPHGQPPTGNQLVLKAAYLDPQGRSLTAMPDILPLASDIPGNVGFVQVTLDGLVDTYFARVVGQPDLPIGANAYAGQCSLGDGIYPIGVAQSNIQNGQMRKPSPPDANNDGIIDDGWRQINSGPYAGLTSRYLYMREDTQPGSFGFLRWMDGTGQSGANANSARELSAAMTGEGNLSWGFEEAPEPGAPNGQLNAPGSTYPLRPGEINEGDWIHASTGRIVSVTDEIQAHVDAGTILTLPIYDQTVGNGSNASFRVVEFGRFVLLNWESGGNNPYFEMVYLGPATMSSTACQFSSVPVQDEDCCELWGDVAFWPEYQIVPQESKPIQYVVVLDVSGSMSANFNGQCDNANPPLRNPQLVGQPTNFRQCSNGPIYTDVNGNSVPGNTEVTGTGATYWWLQANERRVYVAKHAIESMIKALYMPGNASYQAAPGVHPADQFAFVWFTDNVSATGNAKDFGNNAAAGHFNFFTTNPASAVDAVMNTTSSGNDIYRVQGGTNGAGGLYRAWKLLEQAPTTVVHNGRTIEYKRVVIFITDGVSNQVFSPTAGNYKVAQSDSKSFKSSGVVLDANGQRIAGLKWEDCKAAGGRVIEIADCQTTLYGGYFYSGTTRYDRPISQAINVSNDYLKGNGVEVFALALSNLPTTGLASGVPSTPAHYRSAADLVRNADGTTNVDQIMLTFREMIADDRCQRGLDPAPITTFPATSFRSTQLDTGETLNYPNVGLVRISNSVTGQQFSTFIKIDQDGKLRYRFGEKIPTGLYTLRSTLYYINPNDLNGTNSPARGYGDIWDGASRDGQTTIDVNTRNFAGSLVPSTRADLDLRLTGDVCPTTTN